MTGNPVRQPFTEIRNRPYPPVGPNGEDIKILILGGSLGAKIFSEVVPRAIADMPEALRRRFAIRSAVPGGGYGSCPGSIRQRRHITRACDIL